MSVSDALKDLLLEIGQQSSLESVLRIVVERLADEEHIALARIWLIQSGDECDACPMPEACADHGRCLQLVASSGSSLKDGRSSWNRLDGEFSRFPLGVRKVGRIGATGECVAVLDLHEDTQWIARPEWARKEAIRGFVGQPLLFKGEVLGVVAIFTRTPLSQQSTDWLRMIADLVAAAIANARAFDQIRSLRNRLELENAYLKEEVSDAKVFGEIVGQSPALRNIIQQIELVAPTDASVLILGESGTGKELVAQEIHRRSNRHERVLIRVNCASVPRELYESEFFGHAKGAFTGAVRDRAGRFELANGGTLLLDEIGEIPLELQSKLLRVLQEGTYERVGEERTREVDVRLIAATNRDLRGEVDAGQFRQDLYYRLNVFPIEVPPLRKRKEDIPVLAELFLQQASRRYNRQIEGLSQANILILQAYDWPGNVRELLNVIERAVITSRSGVMHIDLPGSLPGKTRKARSIADAPKPLVVSDAEMKRRERENILTALDQTSWQIHGPNGAARLLGLRPTTLASRIKRMGLTRNS